MMFFVGGCRHARLGVATAIECTSRAPELSLGHVWLAANLAQLGLLDEAHAGAAEVLRIQPKYTIDGTQTAPASSEGGMSRPSAFAVLRRGDRISQNL